MIICYKRFQFGWMICIIFTIMIAWMTFAYIYQWGNNPLDLYNYIFFEVLFGVILAGFYGMTVIVTDNHIIIKFGIGLYTKKIDLSKVRSVTVKEYPVYYGYGIRILPNGVLFNVSGNHAIEVRFKNKGNVIQIGTDDWLNLKAAIEENLNNS